MVKTGQVGGAERGRQLCRESLVAVKGGFHGLSVEALAVAEGDVLAQVEGVLQRVVTDLPAAGQPRDDAACGRVLVGERFGDVAQQYAVLQPVDLERVDADQGGVVAPEGDVQGFAGAFFAGGGAASESEGQGGAGQQVSGQVEWGHGAFLQ
ncbi:hypothetical protein D3C80_1079840 [compost metagenome]